MSKFKKHLQHRSETTSNPLAGKSGVEPEFLSDLLSFNFKQLDISQGQTFDDWDKAGLLKKMLDERVSCGTECP